MDGLVNYMGTQPTDITEEEIEELIELEKKATEGPWDFCYDGSGSWSVGRVEDPQYFHVCALGYREDIEREENDKINHIDSEFIAKSRNLLPRLLQAYKKQKIEIEKMEEALKWL